MSSYHVTAALASERREALLAEAATERLVDVARQARRTAQPAQRSTWRWAVTAFAGARR